MKKIIYCLIITSLLSSNAFSENTLSSNKSNPLTLSSMYISKLSTSNEVFDIIIKEYIQNFQERQEKLVENIDSFNAEQNKKLSMITKKINAAKNEIARASEKESGTYEFNRITKLKLDNQAKLIAENHKLETSEFLKIFKSTMSDYRINTEEKKFLAINIKKVSEIIKNTKISELDTFADDKSKVYEKSDIGNILNSLPVYDKEYENMLTTYNNQLDRALSSVLWENMRSKVKIP